MLELVGDALGHAVSEQHHVRASCPTRRRRSCGSSRARPQPRIDTLAFEAAGSSRCRLERRRPDGHGGLNFLMRQGGSIGGGTVEMARNVISERVLSMPRERRLDKDVPFRDVPRGRSSAA